ncbi:hypothetical protein Cfor_11481 [Coptotermes formosanus]|uniref:Uncharacterized protein n=1 Tax=Coptotermes formosanus TaxID=36987 RepID=A0A6L2Q0U5_COPFO|nr:hypothetical protein Cfor_11481 [Coptotermes formosanus]
MARNGVPSRYLESWEWYLSMTDNQVAGIKPHLANASLHASPEWMKDCVESFISEHQDRGVNSYFNIPSFIVFLSLLLSYTEADLRQMEQGCLPPNLSSIRMIVLPGQYALQQIIDVGQSPCEQLQEIRRQVNENVEVGATTPEASKSCPTRTLKLALCNGI